MSRTNRCKTTIRVKYPLDEALTIKQAERETLNEAIIKQAETKKGTLKRREVYNLFTGKGKLHGLNFKDFQSFHAFTAAKKIFETGQFFTPHHLAEKIVSIAQPFGYILDPCCGSSVFCNFLVEKDFTGVELDEEAVAVSKYLYPHATIIEHDIRYWRAKQQYDFILTNPPYNLRWYNRSNPLSSQSFILRQAKEWLSKYGIFLAIVPYNYLNDDFFFSKDIAYINEHYTWLGSVRLPKNSFQKAYQVFFETKVIAFQNCSPSSKKETFQNDYLTWKELANRIEQAKARRQENILETVRQGGKNDYCFSNSQRLPTGGFDFQVRKYLYEIRQHATTQKYLNQAIALLNQLKNQVKPAGMEWEEWEQTKLQEVEVIKRLKRFAKATQAHKRNKLNVRTKKACPIQTTAFKDLIPDLEDVQFLNGFTFKNEVGEHHLTNIQKEDTALMLRKQYGILNWQQGIGKTVASYAICERRNVRLRIILSKPLAIKNTWIPFLKRNKEEAILIKKESDLDLTKKYWCITLNTLARSKRLQKRIKKTLRQISNKVQLIVDESDNLCNRSTSFYKSTRSALRKCQYKLLTTGTTTRNHAGELYPQLELLYNNSNNLRDENYIIYYQNKEGKIQPKENPNYNKPYHPYFGLSQYAAGFSPSKATVFGIEKHNQDVYNYDRMVEILSYTSIIRTFEEVVGKKHDLKQIKVQFTEAEKGLQIELLKEFHRICYIYFHSTGNARKEAGLMKMRQLRLLIKSTSIPESFIGHDIPISTKRQAIYKKAMAMEGKVCIGCTLKSTTHLYYEMFGMQLQKPIFLITGETPIKKREKLCAQFEATFNGILICTQQSLESSVNIPSCNTVYVEALQWNLSRMSQFYFRFIRFNSKENTDVWFINYEQSIENNLLSLVMAKERINRALKLEESTEQEELFDLFGLDWIEEFLQTEYNEETEKYEIGWGEQVLQ